MTLKEEIIRKLIKDKNFADELCDFSVRDEDMMQLVCHAPISLFEKRDLYKRLVEEHPDETGNFVTYRKYLSVAEKAISDMKLPKDGTFLLVGHDFSDDEEQFGCAPFRSYEKAVEDLTKTFKDGGEENVWYTLEKWLPESEFSLDLIEVCEFTFIGDKPCFYKNLRYFYDKEYRKKNMAQLNTENDFTLYSSGSNLNLTTPFQSGDVLHIDCRPFAPATTVVVADNHTPYDCCSPQCEYIGKDGVATQGALKHSHIYKENVFETVSPLYNLVWEKKYK